MRDEQLLERATEIFESKYTRRGFKWTPHVVADYVEEAVVTTRGLPAARVPDLRKSYWIIIRTPNELAEQSVDKTTVKSTADAIARQEQTLTWMQWLTVEERKLVWMCGAKARWKDICKELRFNNRISAWRKWQDALEKISSQLNKSKTLPDSRIYERPR